MQVYLIEATDQQVQVTGDLVEAMAAKDLVDELHHLDIGEEVPVIDCEMSSYLS